MGKTVQRVKKQAKVLTPGQLVELWSYSGNLEPLLKLAYLTCSRCSEIRELTRDAIVGDTLIILQSKVASEKRVPIDGDIARVLSQCDGDRYLFPSPINSSKPMGRTWVHLQLETIAGELGLNDGDNERSPKVTTHSFRRSRCTHLYQGGMTPAAICRLSGHKSVAQLMTYIGIAEQETATQAKAIDRVLFPNGL